MRIRQPAGEPVLPIVAELEAGEREVLALGTEVFVASTKWGSRASSPGRNQASRSNAR
jgi:hypothetical protein